MADVIERAKARRAELMAEVGRIDELLSRHRNLAAEIAAIVDGANVAPSKESPEVRKRNPPTGERKRGPNGSRPDEIIAAAKEVLCEAGKALNRFDLIPLIEAKGFRVGGVDKPRNLGTILWRSKEFDSTGDGYWPKDAPPEPYGEAAE